MKLQNKILPLLFSIGMLISCNITEAPTDIDISENEIFIEGDGGTRGMEVLNSNGFVLFNTNRFSVLDENGEVVRQVPARNHVLENLTVDVDHFYFVGRSNIPNNIALTAYNLNGDLVWEKFIPHIEMDVEAPNVKVIENQLILAYISKNKEGESQNQRTVNIEVFSKNGSTVETSRIIFEAEIDFSTYNLLIESNKDFLVQGSRIIPNSQIGEPHIQVYRFQNGELVWYKALGLQDNSSIWSVIESPSGGFLFVGYIQKIAWAFELDGNGNTLWDLNHGDGTNSFKFFNALYTENSIHFCGLTNSTSGQLDAGLLFTTGLTGSGGIEKIYGGENLYRLFALASRQPDELVLAGDRSFLQRIRYDSWIMFTDGSGERD